MKLRYHLINAVVALSILSCNDSTSTDVVQAEIKTEPDITDMEDHEMPFGEVIEVPHIDSFYFRNYLHSHEVGLILSLGMPLKEVKEICKKFSIHTKVEEDITYLSLDLNDDGSPEKNTTYEPWPDSKPFPVTPISPHRENHIDLTFKNEILIKVAWHNLFLDETTPKPIKRSKSDREYDISLKSASFRIILTDLGPSGLRSGYVLHKEKYYSINHFEELLDEEFQKLFSSNLAREMSSEEQVADYSIRHKKNGKTFEASLEPHERLLRYMHILNSLAERF